MKTAKINWLEADWDSKNSRYQSLTYFEDGHVLDGYSGKIDIPEPIDGLKQWQKWVLRLFDKGYLNPKKLPKRKQRVERIEFYLKGNTGDYDLHFITLFNGYASYNTTLYTKELGNWVKLFYELIKAGQNPSQRLSSKIRKKANVLPSENNNLFINKHDLRQHCISMLKSKSYELGFIENYYRQYVSNRFKEFSMSDEQFLNHLKGGKF